MSNVRKFFDPPFWALLFAVLVAGLYTRLTNDTELLREVNFNGLLLIFILQLLKIDYYGVRLEKTNDERLRKYHG